MEILEKIGVLAILLAGLAVMIFPFFDMWRTSRQRNEWDDMERKLIQLAGGSHLYLESVIYLGRNLPKRGPIQLEDLVVFIVNHRDAWHQKPENGEMKKAHSFGLPGCLREKCPLHGDREMEELEADLERKSLDGQFRELEKGRM